MTQQEFTQTLAKGFSLPFKKMVKMKFNRELVNDNKNFDRLADFVKFNHSNTDTEILLNVIDSNCFVNVNRLGIIYTLYKTGIMKYERDADTRMFYPFS